MRRNSGILFAIVGIASLGLFCCRPASTTEPAPKIVEAAPGATGYWIDPKTKLTWAAKDSGYNVNWDHANQYCSNLTTGGFQDWILPTIEQLESISWFGENDYGYPVKGNIRLTACCEWSSTKKDSGEAWRFTFSRGGRDSNVLGTDVLRALCVRRSKEP